MALTVTITELRNMSTDDLAREIRTHQTSVAKLRMGIFLQKEKDSAKLRRERKTLARLMTVLREKSPKSPKKPRSPKNDRSSASSESPASSSKALKKPSNKSILSRS